MPEIDQFGDAIMTSMTEHFGNALPEMLIEPGRFIVGDAGLVSAEVVLVSRRDRNDPVRWVYLDIGRFGGLAETEGEAIKYRITTPHDGSATGPVAIAGPTCDGADILYEKSNYRLPLALTFRRSGGTAVHRRVRDDLCQPAVQRLRAAGGVLRVKQGPPGGQQDPLSAGACVTTAPVSVFFAQAAGILAPYRRTLGKGSKPRTAAVTIS